MDTNGNVVEPKLVQFAAVTEDQWARAMAMADTYAALVDRLKAQRDALMEACKAIVKHARITEDEDGGPLAELSGDYIDDLRAAIRKAGGEA